MFLFPSFGVLHVNFVGQNVVDIYFIAGQSNAGNLGALNSYDAFGYDGNSPTINANSFDNQSEAGFELTFSRIAQPRRTGASAQTAN